MNIGEPSQFQKDNRILVSAIHAYRGQTVPPTVTQMIKSCTAHNVQVTLLAHDKEWLGNYNTKLVELRNCLETLKRNYDWVLHLDAFDSLMIRPLEDIFAQRLPGRMLWSAERNCYPCPELADKYPACNTSYKYLNGGCWLAPMTVALETMRTLKQHGGMNCDQICWSNAYLSGAPITLDNTCKVFMCLWGHGENELDAEGRNTETGERPCILHGNGNNFEHPIMKRRWR